MVTIAPQGIVVALAHAHNLKKMTIEPTILKSHGTNKNISKPGNPPLKYFLIRHTSNKKTTQNKTHQTKNAILTSLSEYSLCLLNSIFA